MSTFIEPVRDYKFSDSRLIELALEKIALAGRDATELATVGITEEWVEDLNELVLAFGAMPTDTIEIGEQKEATDEKETDADLLLDKLKELRSAAKRALGEKSSAYGKFGFHELDKFSDGDLVKAALVLPALTTKHAVVLATKGWEAADNTELQTMLTAFVGGLQNQRLEVDSRDTAAENRITAGNNVFNLLNNELCEAAKSYWRTRSEAKYNDYIIYNTPSGSSGTNLVFEADVPADGLPHNIQLGTFEPTPQSRVIAEITGGELDLYADEEPNELPSGTFYHHNANTTTDDSLEEFTTLCGFSETNTKFNVRNAGVSPTHYKITFTNVIVP